MDTPSKNTRTIIFDGICTMAMNAFFAGPFLAAFALALGASHWEIGLISAVVFLSIPMQAVGLYAVDRWKRRRGLVIFCALTARLLWILIACLPFFPTKASVRFLLIVLVCSGLTAAIPGPDRVLEFLHQLSHAFFCGLYVRALATAHAGSYVLHRASATGFCAFRKDLGNLERQVFE